MTEFDDDQLGEQLRGEVPDPGPGYWQGVDARLDAVDQGRPPTTAGAIDNTTTGDVSDTDATVVRPTIMNTPLPPPGSPASPPGGAGSPTSVYGGAGAPPPPGAPPGAAPGSGSGGGQPPWLWPVAAAAALVLLAGVSYLLLSGGDDGDSVSTLPEPTLDAVPTAIPATQPTPEGADGADTDGGDGTADDGGDDAEATSEPAATPTPLATPEPTATPTPEVTPTPTPAPAFVPPPGRVCYTHSNDTSDSYLRLDFGADAVAGDQRISIADEENGYFAAGFERIDGPITSDGASVDITTWIEFDVQNRSESWTFTPATLTTPRLTYDVTDCSVVNVAFQDIDGFEAADRTEGIVIRVDDRISFDPGGTSAAIGNAVILGERDRYVLEASGGQEFFWSISSLEDNAVVDIISPSGILLELEAKGSGSILLPHNGDYVILVGPDRGNATYDLFVEVL